MENTPNVGSLRQAPESATSNEVTTVVVITLHRATGHYYRRP